MRCKQEAASDARASVRAAQFIASGNDSVFEVLRKLFALLERTNTSATNNRDRISPAHNDIFQVGPFILSLFACLKELTWA